MSNRAKDVRLKGHQVWNFPSVPAIITLLNITFLSSLSSTAVKDLPSDHVLLMPARVEKVQDLRCGRALLKHLCLCASSQLKANDKTVRDLAD